jgi:signal transduction histidine kinase/DNA-binding response OmpR family regulator/ligand-binding sensor domain-containing protein
MNYNLYNKLYNTIHALILTLAVAIVSSAPVNAQLEAVQYYGINQGLSQGMVYDIYQTRDGFIWVATKDGLNQFDGYKFKSYNHNPFDVFSIADDIVTCIFEDSRGWLWIGTANKGLDILDRKNGRFYHLNFQFAHNLPGYNHNINRIIETSNGDLWIIQQGRGLARIRVPVSLKKTPTTEELKQLDVQQIAFADWASDNEVLLGIWEEHNGDLIVSSKNYFYRVVHNTTIAQSYIIPNAPEQNYFAEKSGNSYWFLGYKNQLIHLKNGVKTVYTSPFEWGITKNTLKKDKNGTIWFAFSNRLWRLDADKKIDFNKPDYSIDKDVNTVWVDNKHNLWVGTTGYGLRKISAQGQIFSTGASGKSIWKIWKSHQGRYLWAKYALIFEYFPESKTSTERTIFPEHEDLVQKGIHFEQDGSFWLFALEKAHKAKGSYLFFYGPDQQLQRTIDLNIGFYEYAFLYKDQQGFLWATGFGCTLARIHPVSGAVTYFHYNHLFGDAANAVMAICMTQDRNGTYWIGTQQGLVKATLDAQQQLQCILISANSQQPNGLNNNSIACLLPDPVQPDQILWIGTKGDGINKLHVHTGRMEHLSIRQGMPDKTIYAILPGNEDPSKSPVSLWCSTNKGLVRVIPKPNGTYEITNYTVTEGLQDNEFNTQAGRKAPDGELLFGGVNGFNHFFPEHLHPDTSVANVFVTNVAIDNRQVLPHGTSVLIQTNPEYLQTLDLRHDQLQLSFEFSILDYTSPQKNRYRYKMEGLDRDWVEAGNQRIAHYHHVPAGSYRFLVQGSNGNGQWADASPITITVHPPWWRSVWAYLTYILLFSYGLYQLYQMQIQKVKARQERAFAEREVEQIKAVEQMKTNFFNNMTHEFRTPLTLIIEPTRRIIQQTKEDNTRQHARLVEKSSHQLLQLVSQLLDLAKLEAGHIRLDLRQQDFMATLDAVYQAFAPMCEEKGIQLTFEATPQHLICAYDAERVSLIINNLLSNAVKFTPTAGSIHLSCHAVVMPDTQQFLRVQCADTGAGIPASELEHIFGRYYQGHTPQEHPLKGTGIGLALCRELAELMGGSVSVQSEEGQGSIFTFQLPIQQTEGAPEVTSNPKVIATVPALPATTDLDHPLVLVIEDHTDMRQFITECLQLHWRVITAPNGLEGIEVARQQIPDMVISDVMMPHKSGFEVCEALKLDPITAHIPIILLTAKVSTTARIKGLRAGADEYLPKPFSTEELLARMDNILQNRERLRQLWSNTARTSENTDTTTKPVISPLDQAFMERFTELVETYLTAEDIGVEEYAQKLFISRVQLHRKLKAITGLNVTDFVRNYRLDKALQMLRKREGLVYEVAYLVGFSSEKYFARAFKERFGMTPSQAANS